MSESRLLAPGTYVRFKGNPLGLRNRMAAVVEHEPSGGVILQTEGSDCTHVMRHEISVMRTPPETPMCPMRRVFPYGKWTCSDGREVLFNRDYKPIWQRYPGKAGEVADCEERVKFTHREWFYTDVDQPWRSISTERKCNRILETWGISTAH